jgi:hypothetical protein
MESRMVATMRGINALVVLKMIIAQVVVPRSIEMMNAQRHKRYILLQHLPIGEKEGRRTQARASSKIITYGGLNLLIGSSRREVQELDGVLCVVVVARVDGVMAARKKAKQQTLLRTWRPWSCTTTLGTVAEIAEGTSTIHMT